jgi:hypothetical protein
MGGACNRNRGEYIGYWWESQKERDNWEDQDVGEWTTLKWILQRYDGMGWIGLIWLTVLNLRAP